MRESLILNNKIGCVVFTCRQTGNWIPACREYQISMEYFVYILKSEKDGRLYKGHTSNLESRMEEQNSGKTKSTKGYRPWSLQYFEKFETREEAINREKYFKTGIGREFLNKLLKNK